MTMDNLSDDNDEEAKISLIPHRHLAKPTAFHIHPSRPPPTPPPPTVLSEIPYRPYDDAPPHPSSFMLVFLIALTCGLLLVTLISTLVPSDSSNPNPNPNNLPPSLSIKSVSFRSLTAGPRHVTAELAVELSLQNPNFRRRLSLLGFAVKASAFQNCDLLAECEVSERLKRIDLAPGNSTSVTAALRGVKLGVTDWIVDDHHFGRDNRAVGVASFGMMVAIETPVAGEERVEFRCGTVVVGFSTQPVAGKLLFGPAECWLAKGDYPPCF